MSSSAGGAVWEEKEVWRSGGQSWRPGAEYWRRRAVLPGFLALLIVAIGIAAFVENQPLFVWAALAPGIWLALQAPEKLVGLLLLTTPMFPVIRVLQDGLGAQQVSTRGLFFSLDDPITMALLFGASVQQIRHTGPKMELFPTALLGLAALYPLVIALNLTRLDGSQSMLSCLYYLKWLQYASLLVLIPAVTRWHSMPVLLRTLRRCVVLALVASALLACYEFAEALRTGSYRSAGAFPRASGFFGTLDPSRFGASEDPVNFGVLMMAGGAIALAYATQTRTSGWVARAGAFVAALAGVFLSASRTPLLAACVAYSRLRQITFMQAVATLVFVILLVAILQPFFPSLWATTWIRFESILFEDMAIDGSAQSRLDIVLNAPVFEWDSYWLAGHGHSSYRFIAGEHLSRFTSGISRSLYNFPLTVWYDVGPVGLLLWCVLYVQLRRRLARIAAQTVQPELRALAGGLQAGLLGLAVASMFGEFPYNWRVMGFFYACCGVCLACDQVERHWRRRESGAK